MAVVVPNQHAMQAWAKEVGQAGEFEELCKADAAKKYILDQLTETGKKGKVSGTAPDSCRCATMQRGGIILCHCLYRGSMLCKLWGCCIVLQLFFSTTAVSFVRLHCVYRCGSHSLPCLLNVPQLKGFEMIKAVSLDPVMFDVERDLLTPTFKKKRPQLLKHYQVSVISDLVSPTRCRFFSSNSCFLSSALQAEIDAMYAALRASAK